MKKVLISILAIAVGIIILWVVARATHVFETYNVATNSNEPTYKTRQIVFASCLKKPDYNSFVAFKQPNGQVWIFRCIAKGGDMVEIKDTKVYLNGKLLNEPYVYNEYTITAKQLSDIAGYAEQYQFPVRLLTDSLRIIAMTEKQEKEFKLNLKLFILPKGAPNQDLFGDFKLLKYNEDNLGPVKVPENSYFLLGDNRHNAMDSRFLGFISKDDVISTVLN